MNNVIRCVFLSFVLGLGVGKGLSEDGPPDPSGLVPPAACCFFDGSCTEGTQEDCENAGGVFQGMWPLCDDVSCEPGACCLVNYDACIVDFETSCANVGGAFQGPGTICGPYTCYPCAEPPSDMAAWWPFDESAGPTAYDIVGGNHGTLMGDTLRGSGKVDAALFFDGVGDHVMVPDSSSLNLGTGSMSLDAWVYVNPTLQPFSGNTILEKGAAYWLMAANWSLGFHMHFGPGFQPSYSSNQALPTYAWTHVAATVDQGNGTSPPANGLKFYVNGQPFGSTVTLPYIKTLSSTDPLLIGGDQGYYGGWIDEVEIFDRVLDPTEIQTIFQAGPAGKCKDSCHLPSSTSICIDDPSVVVTLSLCNYSTSPRTYQLLFSGLPENDSSCTIDGPTTFTVLGSNPVTVPAQSCAKIKVEIDRPPGFVGDVGCYQWMAQDLASGDILRCMSSLVLLNYWCFLPGIEVLFQNWPLAFDSLVEFTLQNSGIPGEVLAYTVTAYADNNTDEPTQAIRLNGLPPGTPVEGILVPEMGDTETVGVEVELVDFEAFRSYDIVLSADADGDGAAEPLGSVVVKPAVPCQAALIADEEDFDGSPSGWSLLGEAQTIDGAARLVESGGTFDVGGVFSDTGYETDDFEVEFDFTITNPAGGVPDGSGDPDPDGLAFVVASAPVSELGFNGYGLGYEGFPTDSFAVEFDTFHNFIPGQPKDPDGNHLGIDAGGNVESIATAFVGTDFDETGTWHANVEFRSGNVKVILTPPDDAAFTALQAVVPTENIPTIKYLGFTAGTGANSADTNVDNVLVRRLDAGCGEDCNGNGVLDATDIADETSMDHNGNGVPDECDVPTCGEADLNLDGTVDPLDAGYVLARLGCDVQGEDHECHGTDVNADGEVDPLDVGYVLARFGDCL